MLQNLPHLLDIVVHMAQRCLAHLMLLWLWSSTKVAQHYPHDSGHDFVLVFGGAPHTIRFTLKAINLLSEKLTNRETNKYPIIVSDCLRMHYIGYHLVKKLHWLFWLDPLPEPHALPDWPGQTGNIFSK